jgi:hypothetical protein
LKVAVWGEVASSVADNLLYLDGASVAFFSLSGECGDLGGTDKNARAHDAVIRVYDEAGNVIQTHEQNPVCSWVNRKVKLQWAPCNPNHVRPEHSNRMAQLMSDEAPANVVPMPTALADVAAGKQKLDRAARKAAEHGSTPRRHRVLHGV